MRVQKLVLAMLWLLGATPVWGDDLPTLSLADLSQHLVEVESRIQDVDVRMTVTSHEFVGAAPGQYVNSVRWVFRLPFGSRFRLEQEGVKPWDRGAQDTLAMAGTIAFDGVDSWSLWRFGGTMNEALAAPAQCNILGGRHPGVDLGEGYRDMTFWRHGQLFSEVIQAVSGATVEVDSIVDVGPVYRVSVPWNEKHGEELIGPETVYLDPARGYAIIRVEEPSRDPSVLNSLLRVTALTQAAPGVWMPTDGISEWWGNGNLTSSWRCQVNSVTINTNPAEELFSVDFPAGSLVSDLRTEISFKVGFDADGAEDGMEAQARAAKAAVDQLAAGEKVQLPVLAPEQVTVPPSSSKTLEKQKPLSRWLIASSLVLALALASVIGATAIRVRKARRILFSFALAIGVLSLVFAGAGTYRLERVSPEGPPSVSENTRTVFDCGRSVLGVLAKYYDTGWGAEDIVTHTGTRPGMSLLEIRDAARAMGLSADGVQVRTADQLQEMLREPRSSAVIATSLGQGERQIGHFFCTVGADTTHFIAIDAPRPVHLLTSEDMANAIERGRGYALLVQPPG